MIKTTIITIPQITINNRFYKPFPAGWFIVVFIPDLILKNQATTGMESIEETFLGVTTRVHYNGGNGDGDMLVVQIPSCRLYICLKTLPTKIYDTSNTVWPCAVGLQT